MSEQETRPKTEEARTEAPRFPEWMAQMMSACGPKMGDRMGDRMAACCESLPGFADSRGGAPVEEPIEKD